METVLDNTEFQIHFLIETFVCFDVPFAKYFCNGEIEWW